ncbi:trichohyalin-like [Rhineura floridana]|uniref:trichohyalin-like n=1 Tax=Rhineura floridana TaxID=261503 RepID=UPI002AC8304F|nr:trichohyalin-like [Rhineura floridana]
MAHLLDSIHDITGVFYKHAKRHGGSVTLSQREMKRLIKEELAEVIKNTCDPQTLQLMFQQLEHNKEGVVDFNSYLHLLFNTAKACFRHQEARGCFLPCDGSRRKEERRDYLRREPVVQVDEGNCCVCQLELRGDCRKDCPPHDHPEREDECEDQCREFECQAIVENCGQSREQELQRNEASCRDLLQRDDLERCHPLCQSQLREGDERDQCSIRRGEDRRQCQRQETEEENMRRPWLCGSGEGEGGRAQPRRRDDEPNKESFQSKSLQRDCERRRPQICEATLREAIQRKEDCYEALEKGCKSRKSQQVCYNESVDCEKRRSWSCEQALWDEVQRSLEHYEHELLENANDGRFQACKPGVCEDDQRKQGFYDPGTFEGDVEWRRSEACKPGLCEDVQKKQQYCDPEAFERDAERRRPQTCKPGLREDSQKQQQQCEIGSFKKGAGRRRSARRQPQLCEDVQKKQLFCDPETFERDTEPRKSEACKPEPCEDRQHHQCYEAGAFKRGMEQRRSLRHERVCQEDIRGRQQCFQPEPMECDGERRRLQGCESGLRECIPKKQLYCEPGALDRKCERRRPLLRVEKVRRWDLKSANLP